MQFYVLLSHSVTAFSVRQCNKILFSQAQIYLQLEHVGKIEQFIFSFLTEEIFRISDFLYVHVSLVRSVVVQRIPSFQMR